MVTCQHPIEDPEIQIGHDDDPFEPFLSTVFPWLIYQTSLVNVRIAVVDHNMQHVVFIPSSHC